jgi:hypothetical protein
MLLSEIDQDGLSSPETAKGQLQRTVLAFLNAKKEKGNQRQGSGLSQSLRPVALVSADQGP